MMEEEFSEALNAMEPKTLDPEVVALATHWTQERALESYWEHDVVSTGLVIKWSAMSLGVSGIIHLLCASAPHPSTLGFFAMLSFVAAVAAGIVMVLGSIVLPIRYFIHKKMKDALLSPPDGYAPEIGELAFHLQVKMEMLSSKLLLVGGCHAAHEDIEADLAKIKGFQLACTKTAHQLSEYDGFEQFQIDS